MAVTSALAVSAGHTLAAHFSLTKRSLVGVALLAPVTSALVRTLLLTLLVSPVGAMTLVPIGALTIVMATFATAATALTLVPGMTSLAGIVAAHLLALVLATIALRLVASLEAALVTGRALPLAIAIGLTGAAGLLTSLLTVVFVFAPVAALALLVLAAALAIVTAHGIRFATAVVACIPVGALLALATKLAGRTAITKAAVALAGASVFSPVGALALLLSLVPVTALSGSTALIPVAALAIASVGTTATT